MVTNDDGIDSVGLHLLARALTDLGDVVVIAPDREFSGSGAAVGALYEFRPEIRRRKIDGIAEAWSLNGPPALCVLYTKLGVFGDPFDLVVSGINPGSNVGRSVYYSGTVVACLAARNGGAIARIQPRSWLFLVLSGIATGLSWLCYFRALQLGPASKVAPIDKLSLVFVLIAAALFLGERISVNTALGTALILGGVLVLTSG